MSVSNNMVSYDDHEPTVDRPAVRV